MRKYRRNVVLSTHQPKRDAFGIVCARQDSNLEPFGYKPKALTIELRAHAPMESYLVLHSKLTTDYSRVL